jgi:hypothetical protein
VNPKLLKNRRLMFIEDGTEAGAGAPDEGQEPKEPANPEKEPQEPEKKDDDESTLPDWAQKELSRARNEAGKYRTERNDLREKLKDAKTPEDIEAATKEYVSKVEELERELARERVAREFSLPNELAERLRGDTEDELKADAKALQKFARPARGGSDDPKGGLDPSNEPDNFDPKAEAARLRRAR